MYVSLQHENTATVTKCKLYCRLTSLFLRINEDRRVEQHSHDICTLLIGLRHLISKRSIYININDCSAGTFSAYHFHNSAFQNNKKYKQNSLPKHNPI